VTAIHLFKGGAIKYPSKNRMKHTAADPEYWG